jgi:heme exporter protein D
MVYFFSKIVWFFQEYSLFFTIGAFALLIIVVFTLGYLVGAVLVSDAVNRRKLKWRKRDLVVDSGKQIFYFFSKRPVKSFCKVIPRMSGIQTYNMSFFEYQSNIKKVRRLWGSAWIVLSIKFLIFFLTLAIFTNNPWRVIASSANHDPPIKLETQIERIGASAAKSGNFIKKKIKIADLVKEKPAKLETSPGFALVPESIVVGNHISLAQRTVDFFSLSLFKTKARKLLL